MLVTTSPFGGLPPCNSGLYRPQCVVPAAELVFHLNHDGTSPSTRPLFDLIPGLPQQPIWTSKAYPSSVQSLAFSPPTTTFKKGAHLLAVGLEDGGVEILRLEFSGESGGSFPASQAQSFAAIVKSTSGIDCTAEALMLSSSSMPMRISVGPCRHPPPPPACALHQRS